MYETATSEGIYLWPLDKTMRAFGHTWLAGRERRQQWNEYARLCPDGSTFRSNDAYMVYALCEPAGEIRYLGITANASKRLQDHKRADQTNAKYIWLAQLQQQGEEPAIKRLALAYGPRCYAEQFERAWMRVLFAHGCDLLNNEALQGPCSYVFATPWGAPRSSFRDTGNVAAWDKQTDLYLQDGIPSALASDLRWYVYKALEGKRRGYGRYLPDEYALFHYEPTLRRDSAGGWILPPGEAMATA